MSMRTLLPIAGMLMLSACPDATADPPRPPPPAQYVFAVDLSGSITAGERAANEQLLSAFTRTLGFGDRLVVMEAHAQGRRDTPLPLVLDVPRPEFGQPTAEDSLVLSEVVQIAQPRIKQVLSAPVANGTDLFATLHSAAERIQEAPDRRTTLVLMSDMLQCAGGVCMEEAGRIPDAAWIASQKSANALPDLAGACVVVVGADASTAEGQRVRDFWTAYFEAAGARLRPEKYSYQVTTPAHLAC